MVGILVDCTGKYMPFLYPIGAVTLACLISFPFVIVPGRFVLVCCLIGICGLSTLAGVPVMMELAAEVTFPISEGVSAGFMNLFGNGIALVCTVALDRIQQGACTAVQSLCVAVWGGGWCS